MAGQHLTLREKLGYGLGDTACNIVYQALMTVLLYFYTDVYGISAAAAGTLMLVVRGWDAMIDPAIGALADRTRSRHGRYRPWILWGSLPLCLLAVATFTTPPDEWGGKLAYAYLSYALLVTAFSAINIPFSALGGVMTHDSAQRAALQTWRFALAMLGAMLVTTAILPLAQHFGGGSAPAQLRIGFPLAMALLAAVALGCLFACFLFTRERAERTEPVSRVSAWGDVRAMMRNSQWRLIALLTLIVTTRGAMQSAMAPFVINYYLINTLPGYLSEPANLIALFLGLGSIAGLAGAVVANRLIRHHCKIRLAQWALAGTALANLLLFLIARDGVLAALGLTMASNFFHMMFIPILFSTVADTVDYGQRTEGTGAMGMFCAGHLFVLNAANALGASATGWLLAMAGYVPNTPQDDPTLRMMIVIFAGGGTAAAVAGLAVLRGYRLRRGWQARLAPSAATG